MSTNDQTNESDESSQKKNDEQKDDNNDKQKEEKKEEIIQPIKVVDDKSNMLLYTNKISVYLIDYFKKNPISKYLDDNSRKGFVGLKNLGNTCYMNSAIQCLSNCELLTKYFLSGYFKKNINLNSKYGSSGQIANSYNELLLKLWKGTKKYINPSEFRKIFITYVKQFQELSQHDAHEMLIFLLEKLHEDLNRNSEKKYIELNEKGDNETDIEASNRWWEAHLQRDNSFIMDLFSGQYKSTVRCPYCDKISITYDQFSCLELPIDNKCFFGTSYVINVKSNKIRKINLIFGEDENFKDICDKIDCQKTYKGILCRNSKMYLACLKDTQNLYQIIDQCHKKKTELKDRIILYEYEKNDLNNKLIFFVVPMTYEKKEDTKAEGDDEEKIKYFFFPKIFSYSPSDTIQQFYNDIKSYYYKYYKEKDGNFSDDKIKLKIVNNLTQCSNKKYPCDYCHSFECISCEFKFDKKMTMGELQNTQTKVRSFVMFLKIPEENFENKNYDSIKLYDDYLDDEEDFILTKELTLENCLNSLSRCEKLDERNEWYCSKCKTHRAGYKQLELFRLPRYLIIQLKRFKNQFGFLLNAKNSTFVRFPLNNLNLNKYVVGPKIVNYNYNCIGICKHLGYSFLGHYIAISKKEGDWYVFDDDSVYSTYESSIVDSNAYILIYKLVE